MRVAARAEATDLGVHRLRDVDEPLHLFQIGDGVFPSAALPISRFGRAGRLVSGALSIDTSEEEPHYWGDIELGMWALDIWIGSPDDRGRGLGADAVKLALGRVFDQHGAEMVMIDPAVDNHRAIAFYEQLGSNAPGFASSATMSAW